MARITATEMVAPSFTSKEAERLLAALDEGKLGAPDDPENAALRKKLVVVLQVATARERRRGRGPSVPGG